MIIGDDTLMMRRVVQTTIEAWEVVLHEVHVPLYSVPFA
jgi:hypothetical protein